MQALTRGLQALTHSVKAKIMINTKMTPRGIIWFILKKVAPSLPGIFCSFFEVIIKQKRPSGPTESIERGGKAKNDERTVKIIVE